MSQASNIGQTPLENSDVEPYVLSTYMSRS